MFYSGYLPEETFRTVKKEIFEMAEAASDRYDYQAIVNELRLVQDEDRITETNEIALELAKKYTYRPAFIYELENFMSKSTLAQFKKWRKTNRSARPKARCTNCNLEMVVRIVYGMPMGETLFEAADKGRLIIGGCSPRENKYGCTNCGQEFRQKP